MAVVLVVEDEDVLLEMLATVVEDTGHRPLTATNGQEALALLKNGSELPALVISDVMMPQMNGIALAEAIRADPALRHMPVVLMSAAVSPPMRKVADQFVPKPFNIDYIELLIMHYVGSGTAQQ